LSLGFQSASVVSLEKRSNQNSHWYRKSIREKTEVLFPAGGQVTVVEVYKNFWERIPFLLVDLLPFPMRRSDNENSDSHQIRDVKVIKLSETGSRKTAVWKRLTGRFTEQLDINCKLQQR
jgi:hypothetical protein